MLMLHVLITNVFLTNFFVAILTTVYNTMLEKGDFAFKTNLNKFIERYSIVMKDEWGYSELVVHAPPLNLLHFLTCSVRDEQREDEENEQVVQQIHVLVRKYVLHWNDVGIRNGNATDNLLPDNVEHPPLCLSGVQGPSGSLLACGRHPVSTGERGKGHVLLCANLE